MSRFSLTNWLLVLGVVVLAAVPVLFIGSDTEFGGADGVAVERIDESGYQPWFAPLFEPSAETASGLFALQAAIGGAVLGYVFGVARGRRRNVDPPA
ncbi:energy-coupling factor ABC transporter substrate-binding protein [Pseudonocardia sp. DSM 110487]|uniref:energy-coupling factor ABC transporter substrate-binding protein n=1 Tax=Pseudonocardia sp. DSM 110487 TaxID=2865833 RepID=UPI001C6A7E25|nr:energy-coupling factor ABC transporter substrate-binding protein [Pseudonocardia sp. DSM 110487]QYN38389.1 energy-coupling factor ABC transporter substrate-binding protein [Pseudonocardia sp. DSM 110487]